MEENPHPLTNIKIASWPMLMIIIFCLILIVPFVTDIKIIGNLALIEIAMGGLLLSFGELINHPGQIDQFLPAPAPDAPPLVSYKRKSCALGNMFDVLGLILLALGCFDAWGFSHAIPFNS